MLAAPCVASGRLQMPIPVLADPNVGISRWNRHLANARDRRFVLDAAAIRSEKHEVIAFELARDARLFIGDVVELGSLRGSLLGVEFGNVGHVGSGLHRWATNLNIAHGSKFQAARSSAASGTRVRRAMVRIRAGQRAQAWTMIARIGSVWAARYSPNASRTEPPTSIRNARW